MMDAVTPRNERDTCRRCGLADVVWDGVGMPICAKCRARDEARAVLVRSIEELGAKLRMERIRVFGVDMVALIDAGMPPGQIELRSRDGRLLGVVTGADPQ